MPIYSPDQPSVVQWLMDGHVGARPVTNGTGGGAGLVTRCNISVDVTIRMRHCRRCIALFWFLEEEEQEEEEMMSSTAGKDVAPFFDGLAPADGWTQHLAA